jgi:hypothetical protein
MPILTNLHWNLTERIWKFVVKFFKFVVSKLVMPAIDKSALLHEMQQHLWEKPLPSGGSGVIVSYTGVLNAESLTSLLGLGEQAVQSSTSQRKITRRVVSVLIESLQNVSRHGHIDDNGDIHLYLTMESTPLGFHIQCGNWVDFDMAATLRERLAAVNGLSHQELRKKYVETLAEGEMSNRGGAGLGLLSIAKKSQGPLNYEFSERGQDLFLFTLGVLVKS